MARGGREGQRHAEGGMGRHHDGAGDLGTGDAGAVEQRAHGCERRDHERDGGEAARDGDARQPLGQRAEPLLERGEVEAITALVLEPSLKQIGMFAVYLAVLMFRPRGLFGERIQRFE